MRINTFLSLFSPFHAVRTAARYELTNLGLQHLRDRGPLENELLKKEYHERLCFGKVQTAINEMSVRDILLPEEVAELAIVQRDRGATVNLLRQYVLDSSIPPRIRRAIPIFVATHNMHVFDVLTQANPEEFYECV